MKRLAFGFLKDGGPANLLIRFTFFFFFFMNFNSPLNSGKKLGDPAYFYYDFYKSSKSSTR